MGRANQFLRLALFIVASLPTAESGSYQVVYVDCCSCFQFVSNGFRFDVEALHLVLIVSLSYKQLGLAVNFSGFPKFAESGERQRPTNWCWISPKKRQHLQILALASLNLIFCALPVFG